MADRRFEQLVRDHHRAVSAYARSMTSSNTLAEDAVQETFLKAWQHLDSFRGSGSFEGWLIRICRNALFDLANRERRRPTVALDDTNHRAPTGATGSVEVWDLFDALPTDQREALVLVSLLGYSYEDAATILDVPVGTVRSRVHRGRSRLSESLGAAQAA